MSYNPGDRIRLEVTDDDGLPMVRYGFVGSLVTPHGPAVVMLDGDIGGELVELSEIALVSVTTVELTLSGSDLIDEPGLRRGLLAMWQAEADQAGLALDSLHPIGTPLGAGWRESDTTWALAELVAGGEPYVVRAMTCPNNPTIVHVRADRPFLS